MPDITLFHLQASRSIRTAWQLEELKLPYTIKSSERENGVAPPAFKKEAGGLGKFPTLVDGDVTVYESGNIAEYLCDRYDTEHVLLPAVGDPKRYAALQWVHAAEATYVLHALPCLYARWFQSGGDVKETEKGLGKNVIKDLEFLEAELERKGGKWLSGGEEPGLADLMMGFSVELILGRELGTGGRKFERLEKYLERVQARKAYQKAVEKTGYKL